jgi:hypothetical protein
MLSEETWFNWLSNTSAIFVKRLNFVYENKNDNDGLDKKRNGIKTKMIDGKTNKNDIENESTL